ncbi:MAG: hypothetical protein A3G34_11825 [Candidatus Lindowbacteria bacterium RIFCSPLOWO2_12_FULL_62_27]|nr:MAG: hypothetical protein A3G34_11825 [Candidatus Lindowbacteria bacterium RIFCSPLOWO2_12_FULL_62_27]OGH56525.1 MAG: hypothetical protein A3I06_08590 [Candidatus Lindowbacteria bacterium RIFCSPLOWO2_02_FULL_62_12]
MGFWILILCGLPGAASAAAFEAMMVGARPVGMGGAFVAVADDGLAAHYNPAGLANLKMRRIDSAYSDLYNLGLLKRNYMSYAHPKLGRAGAAISWNGLATSQKVTFIDYSENAYGFSVGFPVYRGLAVGSTLKYYWVNYDKKATGYGFDLGVMLRFMMDYRFGVMLRNASHPKIRWATGAIDYLPITWEMGLAADVGRHTLVSIQWDRQADNNDRSLFRVGGEYWLTERRASTRLGVRAGAVRHPMNKWAFTGGLSAVLKGFEAVYGLQFHYNLDEEHTFSLNWAF